jgi:ABC-type dipeptide/oligopeptide/nickel transport system ATPase subunit
VLCQQELSEDAADRFKKFQAFMSDTTEQEAKKAEQTLAASSETVKNLSNQPAGVLTALAEIRAGDTTTAEVIDAWLAPVPNLCESVLAWLDGSAEAAGGSLDSGPGSMLGEKAEGLRERASALDATSFAEALKVVTTQKNELQGAIALVEHKPAILQEASRLKVRAQIEAAKKATDTGPITRKSSDLTRTYVTRLVRDQFAQESESLRLRRITLDDKGGVKGQLRHRPSLLGAVSQVPVTKVLSEGEQSALGLAGFFTEATFDDTKSAIVLDDPVTSLDHVRRSLVAKRLVELAGERQIVVFTHEVTFVGDLVRHAAEAHVPITERSIQRSGNDQPGMSTNKLPWKAKDVAARIDELGKLLAEIRRERTGWDQDTYEEHCSGWAGKLSEAWERTVNLEIVNEVVDRGTSQVRPMKFRIFAAITDKDNEEFQASYGRCSEWARRHDKDPAVNFVAPEPEDMEAELSTFHEWFKRIKSYRGK